MTRTPPAAPSGSPAAPPVATVRVRKPRPPESAFPAPRGAPLPTAVPQPHRLPGRAPVRPALFFALGLSLSALALDCARLDLVSTPPAPDAGAMIQAGVSQVMPPAGAISAGASFEVDFATPMDASLLLSDVASSETVVLVDQANAQVMAAALVHSTLTAAEKKLLVSATVALGPQASSILLTPAQPLAAGGYALLTAARLKDAAGDKLAPTETDYSVPAIPAMPVLVDPPANTQAPLNLELVRVSLPAAMSGSVLAIAGPQGLLAAAAAPQSAGEALIPLCAEPPCAPLVTGATYQLEVDGTQIDGASFTAGSCTRSGPPRLIASALTARDDSAQLSLLLDWPARVTALATPLDGGPSEEDAGAPVTLDSFVACAPSSCAGDQSGACGLAVSLAGLADSTRYSLALALQDDEGHAVSLAPLAFATLSRLPQASLDEVMASPPLPEPREDGEYVLLSNTGSGALDLTQLALRGPDGLVRPLGAGSGAATLLPGGSALAVGASFDPSRYAIPSTVPILRASTQRLLGRGLADDAPPAIDLVSLSQDGGASIVLSSFPGGAFHCAEGQALDRAPSAPDAGQPATDAGVPAFACGPQGGAFGGNP